jgi:hypothetical protein
VERWIKPSLGGVLGLLLLLALGLGPASSTPDRRAGLPDDPAIAAIPPSSATPPASASGTGLSAIIGSVSFVVASALVVFLTASMHAIPFGRRTGSRWLRAPPFAPA